MAGRYVPPHLRDKENAKSSNDNKTDDPSSSSSPSSSKPSIGQQPELYTINEITSHLGRLEGKHGTLNASVENSNTVSFILVFNGQHPYFVDKGQILCKSNLHLLPQMSSPTATISNSSSIVDSNNTNNSNNTIPAEPPPPTHTTSQRTLIPVFTQPQNAWAQQGEFLSLGYHCITGISYLEPRSAELVAMLDAKFKERTRNLEGWEKSLGMRWAVVELDKIEDRVGEGIRREDPMEGFVRERVKGVRELMEEMRIRDAMSASADAKPKNSTSSPSGTDCKETTPSTLLTPSHRRRRV
ncbi:MAG: hypothetical protein M1827_000950 [Pycnora praestabilis]|nr:MAG: hypothetical protein M1827_000950 [Pycnora praestabilis]